jgi:hypothetical protein
MKHEKVINRLSYKDDEKSGNENPARYFSNEIDARPLAENRP